MPKWKIFLAVLSWIPFLILKFVLALIGLFTVAAWCWEYPMLWPKWMWLWNNEEDMALLVPSWFKPDKPRWLRVWLYYAIRNPVNNLRYLFKDTNSFLQWGYSGVLESKDMVELGVGEASRWRQSGWKFSYRKLSILNSEKYREFFIGWKIGMGVPGCGFTLQFRKGRIGN